jgi:hypothetical protein
MNNTKIAISKSKRYSDRYATIRKEAESKWPAWKVDTYNANVAISAHAKKVENESAKR